jgi:aryl-alcohol dehydrogenase-like predicted oxidoreductase
MSVLVSDMFFPPNWIEMKSYSLSKGRFSRSDQRPECIQCHIKFQDLNLEPSAMETRRLGAIGPDVSAIGLGCMSLGIADVYTSSVQDDRKAVELIHRALDLGVNFLDTANIYGDSEIKVGKALRGRRDAAVLATKFGIVPDSPGQERSVDGTPANVRRACDQSLSRLGVERIDLYYLHRVDPKVPIEETLGAMAGLVDAGKVGYLGLSEAAPETVRRGHKVHPLAAIQAEYSLFSREPEDGLLAVLRELGIALVAYSPLGRGFLGGRFRRLDEMAPGDWRRGNPRFQGKQFAKNLAIADRLQEVAREKHCTPAQLALAWLVRRHGDVIPIPGTSSTARLEENVRAVDLQLKDEDLYRIENVLPKGAAVGQRYAPAAMKIVNG